MRFDYLIPVTIIIGFAVLFFFPEPESNFLAYAATALFFAIAIVVLIVLAKKKKFRTKN